MFWISYLLILIIQRYMHIEHYICVWLLSRWCVTSPLPKRPLGRGSVTAGRRCGQHSSGQAASRWLRRWCVMNVQMLSKFLLVKLTPCASGLHSAMNVTIIFQLKWGTTTVPPLNVQSNGFNLKLILLLTFPQSMYDWLITMIHPLSVPNMLLKMSMYDKRNKFK